VTATAPPAVAGRASRRVPLAVLCLGFLMVILDGTIVSVALPTIQADLDVGTSQLAWIVNAYLVAFGGLLLLAGRAGDLLGRRSMFLGGLGVFTLASSLCGLAQTPGQLVAARVLQGAGGALASAVILAMLAALFPDARERASAFAVYAFVGAAGASMGTVAGGLLTDALSWRWIFLVNLPIGVATVALAIRTLPRDKGLGLAQGADVAGAALVVTAVVVGLLAIVGAEAHGLVSARTLGLLVLAAVLLAAFLRREARATTPLVPLRLLRTRAVAAANAVQLLMIAGFFGQQFMLALYLQRVLGFSPTEVGLAMLPIPLAIAATSLSLAAHLIDRLGARSTLLAGMALAATSLAVLARTPTAGSYAIDLFPAFVAFGIGAGLAMPALTTIAMADASPVDAGLTSGLFNTTQQIAASIGLAVLATIAGGRTDQLRTSTPAITALASGYRLALLTAALLVLAAVVITLITLPRRGGLARRPVIAPSKC
jgi:EmrB/QacA subfamily drug resistance transporter